MEGRKGVGGEKEGLGGKRKQGDRVFLWQCLVFSGRRGRDEESDNDKHNKNLSGLSYVYAAD